VPVVAPSFRQTHPSLCHLSHLDANHRVAHLILCDKCTKTLTEEGALNSALVVEHFSCEVGSATIFKCALRVDDENVGSVAVKAISNSRTALPKERWLKKCEHELQISLLVASMSSSPPSDYVVYTYGGYYLEPLRTFVLLTEFAPMGDLFDLLSSRAHLGLTTDNEWMKRTLTQIALGVDCLHRLGVIHMDLKPENVLVYEEGHRVKLCDFGLSLFKSELASASLTTGTLQYCAPELLSCNQNLTEAVDLWGIGCILLVLLTRETPFWRKEDNVLHDADQRAWERAIVGRIRKGDHHIGRGPRQRFPQLCGIADDLLITLPELRMKLPELLAHESLVACVKEFEQNKM